MRLDKPVGIFLLLAPTMWALWIANKGFPNIIIFSYLLLGTFVMRSAGCVINDIADRKIDNKVTRTKTRILANNIISLKEAIWLFLALIFIAFIIVLQLPRLCFYQSILALWLTIIYPFCKRFFKAPQAILGFAFSMGIFIAYSASLVTLDFIFLLLITLNYIWIISYDTMYAMVDKQDDLKIGVLSTAILFGSYDNLIVKSINFVFHFFWLLIAVLVQLNILFYIFWLFGLLIIFYQHNLLNQQTRNSYFQAFSISAWYGMLMWVALIIGYSLESTQNI
ncbi:MAG: 4-hydroxybenzoate octaprenyltransferase [Legionellales bacterium RIFCSPHIGHO2_12_FULL_35_11]|nr:MAG: 4-hydroxybenzoate octaprenyltransferase [Legionellales bacterium RIFCSPHIGHO2_12_FULL_35_11]